MSLQTAEEYVISHKRSRTGCYTCRLRKVKCRGQERPLNAGHENTSDCPDCSRLGLECRWGPPAPDENYSPPPKRRRTIGPRQRHQTHQAGTSRLIQIDDEENATSSAQRFAEPEKPMEGLAQAHRDSSDQNNSQQVHLQDDAFDIFTDLPFEFDDYAAFGQIDLDVAGENLDFIPLPTIDPSELHLGQRSNAVTDTIGVQAADPTDQDVDLVRAAPVDASQSPAFNNIALKSDERRLIQHYLSVMKGYAKVEDRPRDSNNLFISAFSMSLFFPPLYYAILSFSASHMAMEDTSYVDAAAEYETLAEEAYSSHQHDGANVADALLSALFVRVKRIHVTGGEIKYFLDLIARAVEVIANPETEDLLKDRDGLVRRVVIRLAILDARATHYGLGGGALVEHLRQLPCLSSIFDFQIRQTTLVADIGSLLRADVFRMRVAALEARLQKQCQAKFATTDVVRTEEIKALYHDIQNEIIQWDSQAGTTGHTDSALLEGDEILDPAKYGHLAVSLALHSSLLYLHMIYPLPLCDAEASVSKILYGQLRIHRDPSRAASPSSILPSALFLAAICTADPIRRDWIMERFKSAEKWGLYIRKTRECLQAIFERQCSNSVLDVRTIMNQTTGEFII